MRDIWYGDRRDRVKWGALVHLARSQQLSEIIQVAYYRPWEHRKLGVDGSPVQIPAEVWNHFSNLENIQRLEEATGIKIVVLGQELGTLEGRRQYISDVIQDIQQHCENRKVVFLDPDTGIEPQTLKPEHAGIEDIQRVWEALEPGDWLAVYQHAYRGSNWLGTRRQDFGRACGVESIKTFFGPEIAKDVAVFAAQKE